MRRLPLPRAEQVRFHYDLCDDFFALWLDPLRALKPEGEPQAEIMGYVRRKLELSRDLRLAVRLQVQHVGAPQGAARDYPPLEAAP